MAPDKRKKRSKSGDIKPAKRQRTIEEEVLPPLPPTEEVLQKVTLEDFRHLSKLGDGCYSTVYRVIKVGDARKGQTYAMKTLLKKNIFRNSSRINRLMDERNALMKCSGDSPSFVTKMLYAFESKIAYHIVLKYYPRGDVFAYLQNNGCLNGDHLKYFVAEVLVGMIYLHEKEILHRDIKPGNLLIDKKGHVVMADLGFACQLDPNSDNLTTGQYGSFYYMAPEVYRGEYSYKADMWSLGCTIYIVATRKNLFNLSMSSSTSEKISLIKTQKRSIIASLPTKLKSLITQMIIPSVNKRISDKDALAHEYLKKIEWDKIKNRSGFSPFQEVENADNNTLQKKITDFEKVFEKSDDFVLNDFYYDNNIKS